MWNQLYKGSYRFFTLVGILTMVNVILFAACGPDFPPLRKLNFSFRKFYKFERTKLLARMGPIIVANDAEMWLIKDGYVKGEKVLLTNDTFRALTDASHMPLGLYVLIAYEKDGELTPEKRNALMDFGRLVEQAKIDLPNISFETNKQRIRQEALMKTCSDFIADLLQSNHIERKKINAFAASARTTFDENLRDAAKITLDKIHGQVRQWYKSFTRDEKRKLLVVLSGPRMPRQLHLGTTYFKELRKRIVGKNVEVGSGKTCIDYANDFLQGKKELKASPCVIYAEDLYGDPGKELTLNLLGTYFIDTKVGADFFGDPGRLHIDALGPAAFAYVKSMDFSFAL